jgi:hypothetical protein
MTIIDKGCWERGCACYDSRVADETIEVIPRNDALEEVAKEIEKMKAFGNDTIASFAVYIRSMKR